MHRLDLGLYSHPKEFWGNGVRTHVISKGKIPSTRKFPHRRIEPMTLHYAGHRAQTLPMSYSGPSTLFKTSAKNLERPKHSLSSHSGVPLRLGFDLCQWWSGCTQTFPLLKHGQGRRPTAVSTNGGSTQLSINNSTYVYGLHSSMQSSQVALAENSHHTEVKRD